jgi:peptidoglycan/xylan/chitin deacetylase (PgdA/CDA1 family)
VVLVVVLAIAGLAVLTHTAPFPFLLEAFRPNRSLWHVTPAPGTPPTIYLTFDDGPNPDWTPALLDALRDERARATFFLIDDHISSETAPIVKRIADEGHAIGLHSGSRWLMLMSADAFASRVAEVANRIDAIAGTPPCRLFRPHAGWRSATMYGGLERAGYQLAGWSWGMWDWSWWRRPRGQRVAERLARLASAGDIIVIHDGHHKNPRADRRYASEAVRLLVPALRTRGFEFGRLCDVPGE